MNSSHGRHMSLEDMLAHIDRVNVEQVFDGGPPNFSSWTHLAITGVGPLATRSLQAYR